MARITIRKLTPEDRARINAFKDLKVAHPKLAAADARTRELIDEPGDSAAILVQGPTGVGKSTLAATISRSAAASMAAELADDVERFPPIVVRAPAPAGTTFSWRDFLFRAMRALNEPALEDKIVVPRDPRVARSSESFRTIDGIRVVFEDVVRARRPKAIFIDEAQHMVANASGSVPRNQLDFIKSLADATESVFVLVGTYDLSVMRNQSGQLGRRCLDVHFSRYHWDNPAEQSDFRNVVATFGDQIGFARTELLGDLEFIYERSAGCVGILKPWFARALVLALRSGHEPTGADLAATALSGKALLEIAKEIVIGERAFADHPDTIPDLREQLGLVSHRPPFPERRPELPTAAAEMPSPRPTLSGQAAPSRRKRRVGRRGPHRDPVGAST